MAIVSILLILLLILAFFILLVANIALLILGIKKKKWLPFILVASFSVLGGILLGVLVLVFLL